jgi:S-adenosyl-L-methionine hydrolase (adenosine-forming)
VVVTFLSDFGLENAFVGICHGVIRRIAPEVPIIDVTHGVPPQAVLQGALELAQALPYMPVGVHLAVVDPGVGGARRAVALRDGEGRHYVGPDNGLLTLAADRLGGVVEAHELANPDYALRPVSRTFHGRDLFAPAAAHLAVGVALGELGPPIDAEGLVRLELPEPDVEGDTVVATVLALDRFGNAQLNLAAEHLERIGVVRGARVRLEGPGGAIVARATATYADSEPGETVLIEDSSGHVALAVNRGDAARTHDLAPGKTVRLVA